MSINSAVFLLFVAVSLIVYAITPKKYRWIVLLASSVYFYLASSVRAAVYLCATIVITFLAGRGLDSMNTDEKKILSEAQKEDKPAIKKQWQRKKRLLLGAVLVINFLTLAVFKYFDSWFGTINSVLSMLHVSFSFRPLKLLLPLGISFYIFQTAGYLIDIYRGKARAEQNIFKYALFACYFPQMIQGPINRFGELHPQLMEGKDLHTDNIRNGIELMIWGMLKKVFIADVLASGVTEIYANYTAYSGLIVFMGAAMYCVQLYADFSGGTDIIRGVSEMFGITLRPNFERPYFAASVDEFWRRWHISLGDWMKDYLFYPLALSKWLPKICKKFRKPLGARVGKLLVPCVATVIVFLAVGIWQGPGMSNIAYGLWNGLLMSGAMLCEPYFAKINEKLHINGKSVAMHVFRVLRTCFLVVVGRYFSRALSFMSALGMIKQTVTKFTWNLSLHSFFSFGLDKWDYLTVFIAVCVLFCVSLMQEKGIKVRETLAKKHPAVQFTVIFAAVLLLVFCVYLNSDYTAIAYVYENI